MLSNIPNAVVDPTYLRLILRTSSDLLLAIQGNGTAGHPPRWYIRFFPKITRVWNRARLQSDQGMASSPRRVCAVAHPVGKHIPSSNITTCSSTSNNASWLLTSRSPSSDFIILLDCRDLIYLNAVLRLQRCHAPGHQRPALTRGVQAAMDSFRQ